VRGRCSRSFFVQFFAIRIQAINAQRVVAQHLAFGDGSQFKRFNLLAGTVADGVDPTLPESGFALSPLGWFLVALPFIFFVGGLVSAIINKKENSSLVDDMS